MHQIAKKINIEPNYPAFRRYLTNSLFLGMKRQVVQETLEQIGPVQVISAVTNADGSFVDIIVLKKCFHPFNYISIIFHYNLEGELTYFFIDDDS